MRDLVHILLVSLLFITSCSSESKAPTKNEEENKLESADKGEDVEKDEQGNTQVGKDEAKTKLDDLRESILSALNATNYLETYNKTTNTFTFTENNTTTTENDTTTSRVIFDPLVVNVDYKTNS